MWKSHFYLTAAITFFPQETVEEKLFIHKGVGSKPEEKKSTENPSTFHKCLWKIKDKN